MQNGQALINTVIKKEDKILIANTVARSGVITSMMQTLNFIQNTEKTKDSTRILIPVLLQVKIPTVRNHYVLCEK